MSHAWRLRSITTVLPLFLGLLAAPSAPAAQEDEAVAAGEVRGSVVVDLTGRALAGFPVSLLDRATVTDAAGSFRFSDVPVERLSHLNLRITDRGGEVIGCNTISVPVRFYPVAAALGDQVDVAIASPGDGQPVELRVSDVGGGDIDRFCAECHKANPCTGAGSYGGETTSPNKLGGIAVREDEVAGLKERLTQQGLVKEAYSGIRYQDAHPQGIDMDEVVSSSDPLHQGRFHLPPDLALALGSRVTCDTCHTRHVPGSWPQYAVMDFAQSNDLCYQCHQ